ncbi:MAG TPA: PPE family protein [Mycobacterium sp.]
MSYLSAPMSAPVWLALPPEVHSASLHAGPGPGPLLAAAEAWSSLGAAYASTAEELSGLLTTVQADAWQGSSAERYLAAHEPYLNWLSDSAANSATTAGLHQTTAGAYSTALAAMPTLAELATNHTVHATLVATNFFGVNTIPIALNEADYVRMWVQAAETMSVYQAVAGSALAAVPPTASAPPIVSPAGKTAATSASTATTTAPSPSWQDQLATLLSYYTQDFAQPLGELLYPGGWPFPAYPFASGIASWLSQIFPGLSPALASALGWTVFHTLVLIPPAVEAGVAAAIPALPAAGAIGAVGAVGAVDVSAPVGDPTPAMPVAGGTGTPISAGATVPAGSEVCPCADPIPSAGPTAPGAVSGGMPAGGGAAGSGPGAGFGSTPCLYLVSAASSSAKQATGSRRSRSSEEQATESQAAPGEAAAQRLAQKRRRHQRAKQRWYGDESMDMNIEITPAWGRLSGAAGVSESGAGALGFAGTVADTRRRAAGITVLTGDGLDTQPRMPMLPGSWGAEPGYRGSVWPAGQ